MEARFAVFSRRSRTEDIASALSRGQRSVPLCRRAGVAICPRRSSHGAAAHPQPGCSSGAEATLRAEPIGTNSAARRSWRTVRYPNPHPCPRSPGRITGSNLQATIGVLSHAAGRRYDTGPRRPPAEHPDTTADETVARCRAPVWRYTPGRLAYLPGKGATWTVGLMSAL